VVDLIRHPWRLLALSAVLALGPPAAAEAQSALPTTYEDSPMASAGAASDKPQSKLWRHDGSWWALMESLPTGYVHVFKLRADHSWEDTGTVVDPGLTSRGDALPEGNHVYVVSRRGAGVFVARLTYDVATQRYSRDPGFPVRLTKDAPESVNIAKDSTGRLWVTWTKQSQVWVAHSTTSDLAWSAPFMLPVSGSAVAADDISAIVALEGKIGVMWSNQVTDAFYFATHDDGSPPDQWSFPETALSGLDMGDDHINIKKAADGRLFVAIKTSTAVLTGPQLMLLIRSTDGTWSSFTHSRKADNMTRPIVQLDEGNRRVLMFAASPPGAGGQVYYKTTSMDAPAFDTGRGEPFITWPGTTMHDSAGTKQPLDPLSGILVFSGDQVAKRYYHGELPLTDSRPPETTIGNAPSDPPARPRRALASPPTSPVRASSASSTPRPTSLPARRPRPTRGWPRVSTASRSGQWTRPASATPRRPPIAGRSTPRRPTRRRSRARATASRARAGR
jgi:hypothetical protein